MAQINNIVLIGAGNLGTHLGKALYEAGLNILEVYSRNKQKASNLANKTNSKSLTNLTDLRQDADLYILAVSDQAIGDVAAVISQKWKSDDPLVVHTSGATPSTILLPYFDRSGVFYPLQTFTIGRQADFSEIPICIDARNEKDLEALRELGRRISKKVHKIDDPQRAILHVAAVFANNFTNHLYVIAEKLCGDKDIPFDLLRPLIRETAEKIMEIDPRAAQTGPAMRNDGQSIQSHLDYLLQYPELHEIYKQLSNNIQAWEN